MTSNTLTREALQVKLEQALDKRIEAILEANKDEKEVAEATPEVRAQVKAKFIAAFATLAETGLGHILSDKDNEAKVESEVTEEDLLELDEVLVNLARKRSKIPAQIVTYVEKIVSHSTESVARLGTNLSSNVEQLGDDLDPAKDFDLVHPCPVAKKPSELIGEDGESLFVRLAALSEQTERMAASAKIALNASKK